MALSGGLGTAALAAPDDGPQIGDWLVALDAEKPVPLTSADLQPDAKQTFALPRDPVGARTRDGSRLNRILLIKLDPASMDEATRKRAADGVLAYSGVCTHQGCDVSSWRAQEKTLLCFCHFSQFQPAKSAMVVAGPAPRGLPYLPLRIDGGRLVVAGPFSATPGGQT